MTTPTTPQGIRIVVDLNKCQGYAQCCFLSPEDFELHGSEGLWYNPAPTNRMQIIRAAASCPVRAIVVGEAS